MSNPTTPFSWQMPTATDLVTDLPADFEVFGQAVATSMADLLGGTTGQVLSKTTNADMDFTWVTSDDANAIQNSIVDAKGDLIGATAADTPARLAVGTNGQVLTADSTAGTGLKWATPAAAGAYTVIQSGTLSTTSVPLNSIPQTYKHLQLVMWATTFSANDGFALQINGITGSNYGRSSYGQNGGTSVDGSTIVDNGVYYGNGAADPLFSSSFNHWVLDIYDYTNTTGAWAMRGNGTYLNTSSAYSTYQAAYTYVAATATAITSINIKTGGSRTMNGNYILYGVN
jgi:hypothetical protein